MTASALIAHLLDPLIDPAYADEDMLYAKASAGPGDDQVTRDYLRGFKRANTYALDWAGDKLLIAAKDSTLRLYDVEKGEEERSWQGEWMSMQCDPVNPHMAAAVSWSGRFRVFDTRVSDSKSSGAGALDVELKNTAAAMKDFLVLCWSPDGKYIAVNNRSDQVYLLDLRQTGSLRLGTSKSMQQEVNQMAWSADGDTLWIATGGTPGKLHVYPAPSLQSEGAVQVVAHQHTTISVAADPTGRHIASGGGDCLVALWDPTHLVCTRTFGFATQSVNSLSFNHTGSLLAWGTGGSGTTGGEKNLTIVGANTGSLYWQDTTLAPVQQVRWHPKRNVLAYALNVAQLPEEGAREPFRRAPSGRDQAVVHTLRVPEGAL